MLLQVSSTNIVSGQEQCSMKVKSRSLFLRWQVTRISLTVEFAAVVMLPIESTWQWQLMPCPRILQRTFILGSLPSCIRSYPLLAKTCYECRPYSM